MANHLHIVKLLSRKGISKSDTKDFLPAILAIFADLTDMFIESEDYPCNTQVIKCERKELCPHKEDCTKWYRQSYGYCEDHFKILVEQKDLPAKLKLSTEKLSGAERKDLNKQLKMVGEENPNLLAADYIIRLYEKKNWDDYCAWRCDDYIEILAGMFFFNYDLLCCAIKHELRNKHRNKDVEKAIRRCVELLFIADEIYKKDMLNEKALAEFGKSNGIRDIICLTYEDSVIDGDKADNIKKIFRISTDTLNTMRDKEPEWRKLKLALLLGIHNFLKYEKYCRGA